MCARLTDKDASLYRRVLVFHQLFCILFLEVPLISLRVSLSVGPSVCPLIRHAFVKKSIKVVYKVFKSVQKSKMGMWAHLLYRLVLVPSALYVINSFLQLFLPLTAHNHQSFHPSITLLLNHRTKANLIKKHRSSHHKTLN